MYTRKGLIVLQTVYEALHTNRSRFYPLRMNIESIYMALTAVRPQTAFYINCMMVGDYTFSDAPLRPRNLNPCLRSPNSCLISQPFAKSSSFMYSYFSHSICLWNSLPL